MTNYTLSLICDSAVTSDLHLWRVAPALDRDQENALLLNKSVYGVANVGQSSVIAVQSATTASLLRDTLGVDITETPRDPSERELKQARIMVETIDY